MSRILRPLLIGVSLCAVYSVLGRIGISLHASDKYSSVIWAPAGVALGGLFVFGEIYWPAIFVGGFLVNYSVGLPALLALEMASGNVLGALISVFLLRKSNFQSFYTFSDVVKFVFLGVPWGAAFSAFVGTLSLWMVDFLPGSETTLTAAFWWLGDISGVVIVAPFIMVWSHRPRTKPKMKNVIEGFFLFSTLGLLGALMYFDWFNVTSSGFFKPRLYFLYPLITWTAVRFGPRLGSTVVVIYSTVVTTAVIRHPGFFSNETDIYWTGLFQLSEFLVIAGVIELMLSAVFEERRIAIQTRDDFFNIASHELKTPLTSLKLQTQVAIHKLKKEGDRGLTKEVVANLLASNDVQINKLSRLINEMFDVAKVDSGTLRLSLHEMDFSETLKDVISRMNPQISNAGCELIMEVERNLTGVWDRARIEQVLENLIGNACKFGAGRPIEIKASKREDGVNFSVRDHGIGIKKSEQARIFNRFERGTLGADRSGLGLGLYIVTQIVRKHEGRVKVDSDPGRGAMFTLELPRHVTL